MWILVQDLNNMNKILIFILLFSVFTSNAQNRKKKPILKGEVTIKGNFPPVREKPNEEDADIWFEYKSKEFLFDAIFPAKPEDVFDDEVKDLKFFQASTRKATYGVIIKTIPNLLSQNSEDKVYDDLFEQLFNSEATKIITERRVRIGDLSGKEMFFEKDNLKVFSRLYINKSKLYIISINIDKKDYKMSFDKWFLKFLDSFNLHLKIKNEG